MPDSRKAPQIDRLIAEIAARHGVMLKRDDPAFALVTLNQLVLEDAVKDLATQIRGAKGEFESTSERVQARTGAVVVKELRQLVAGLHASIEKLDHAARARRFTFEDTRWLLPFAAGLAAGVLLHWIW